MNAFVQEYPSRPQFLNLNFVEEQENGAGAKSRVCVLLKTISNVTRSTGADADCSYMDKDSQFNMIVYSVCS